MTGTRTPKTPPPGDGPRCEFSDLLTTQCSHCLGVEIADEPDEYRGVPSMYEGWCAACEMQIDIEEMVMRVEMFGWIHTSCAGNA